MISPEKDETYEGPFNGILPNSQPISKMQRAPNPDGAVWVHSIFYTVQGEGPFCGVPAVFIRLSGCNLQCPICDTEYTKGAMLRTPEALVNNIKALPLKDGGLVVLTGGEPFRQLIAPLLEAICEAGYYVQVETNGTLRPPETWKHAKYSKDTMQRRGVYIVCSPKTGKVHTETAAAACCFKYVGLAGELDEFDGLPNTALGHTANPRLARPAAGYRYPIYLQPADEQYEEANQRNKDAVLASCLKHGYTVQLQIHKFLKVE